VIFRTKRKSRNRLKGEIILLQNEVDKLKKEKEEIARERDQWQARSAF